MIHVHDQDFAHKVEESFHEAYMTHTSTSPNYQILASLDLGRRQASLEGYELVAKQIESAMRLREAIDNHPLLARYMHTLTTAELIPAEFRPSGWTGRWPVGWPAWREPGRRTSSCWTRRGSACTSARPGSMVRRSSASS